MLTTIILLLPYLALSWGETIGEEDYGCSDCESKFKYTRREAKGLSPGDPNSYSRPDQVITRHLHLNLEVDFDKKLLHGHVILNVSRLDPKATTLVLDARKLDIQGIQDYNTKKDLKYTLHPPSINGEKLEIKLPTSDGGEDYSIMVTYTTSNESSALQWLNKEQTAGKKYPFLYSQCQPIHCRAMLPCQDTPSVKAPYTASITAPLELTVLMSGIQQGGPQSITKDTSTWHYLQSVPIQSYLIAIAVGDVKSKPIGPRSFVWADPQILEQAAFDFSETETRLQKAEQIFGFYRWGIYDILVLPPFFPFGGMENPCLTFVTPTLLTGDKSGTWVITHEIAHSWTGNLVTNINMEHFWLNEGFTLFAQRKIDGAMYGEQARDFGAILGWTKLEDNVMKYGETNQFTSLNPNLAGKDPDNAISWVPYEKGSTFLWYLEDIVGGADNFDPFLKSYLDHFAYQSIDSEQFKKYFNSFFSNLKEIKLIDWDTWLHSPGMPIYKPKFDESLAIACRQLAASWREWDQVTTLNLSQNFDNFSANQKSYFLILLLNGTSLSHRKLETMATMYKMDNYTNIDVKYQWIRLGLAAMWEPAVDSAIELATVQGRYFFCPDLYGDLYNWEEKRQLAINTYRKYKDLYMPFTRKRIEDKFNTKA